MLKQIVSMVLFGGLMAWGQTITTSDENPWQLLGAVEDIAVEAFEEGCAEIVWSYTDGSWNKWKSSSAENTLSTIAQSQGFWLKSSGVCTIDTSDSSSESGMTYSFTLEDQELGIAGVSPEAIEMNGETWLYITDMGLKLYRSADGLNFTEEVSALLPQGSDPTIIALEEGGYRMYYASFGADDQQAVRTATSSDGLSWTLESTTTIINDTGDDAWGVPDTIVGPDGNVYIYWVGMPEGDDDDDDKDEDNDYFEVILSAQASDGVLFTQDSGYRTEDGYVDPYILKAEEGSWIGLFATTPAEERLPQKVYVGTSADGLSWNIDEEALIEFADGTNVLDPTAIYLGNDQYRVYFSVAPADDPVDGEHTLRSGILTISE